MEVYFLTYKSGCRVETTALLKNCLAFYAIIAWRVMYTTYLSRECPDLPCSTAFDETEWKPVWKIVRKADPPEFPPSWSEFIKLLAELGGYNNREKQAPAGPQAIWVGISRMCDFALAWESFGPDRQLTSG